MKPYLGIVFLFVLAAFAAAAAPDVRLAKPGYRNCYFPGQDASSVRGTLVSSAGGSAELTLSGPGFATRSQTVAAGADFTFDTTGFTVGTAALVCVSGAETNTVRIRRLADTGRMMCWIENGYLVTNGIPIVRRNMYAESYMQGRCFQAKFAAEGDAFPMTRGFGSVSLAPEDIISGIEAKEAKTDVRPCDEYFRIVRARVEANRNRDFAYYYICDEPECRSISPVYLKYVHDFVAELDPYHVIATATRGGARYAECADLLETHPYLNCRRAADGSRTYDVHPRDVGKYVTAFGCSNRSDKVVGLLPTCFAYRWDSLKNDYPTFDEYVLHVWGAGLRGARTLWPYAGHDLGDRPALYEGTRYVFESFEALKDFILFGTRRTLGRTDDWEAAVWDAGGDRMLVVCNFSTNSLAVPFADVPDGSYGEFRGTRAFTVRAGAASPSVTLAPLETLVATTRPCGTGLRSRADTVALVDAEEQIRVTRDNQLLERYEDVTLITDMSGSSTYKLIDGVRDMLAHYLSYATNAFIEVSCNTFKARFSKARVYGYGLASLTVDIRENGAWRRLEPVAATSETWMRELDFGVTSETYRVRFNFPGKKGQRNDREVYEIELPYAGEPSDVPPPGEPVADQDVRIRWDANDCPTAPGWSGSAWMHQGSDGREIVTNADGSFAMTGHQSRYMKIPAGTWWLVEDFKSFDELPPGTQYRGWSASLGSIRSLGGTVTYPHAGIYTFPLPTVASSATALYSFYNYGMRTTLNRIALAALPADRVLVSALGEDAVRPGGRFTVEAHFASPCHDVSATLLGTVSSTGLRNFSVNGSCRFEMARTDDAGYSWRGTVDVRSCSAAAAGKVYARVIPLGSASNRPLFTNFDVPFKTTPATNVVVTAGGSYALAAPDRYLFLTNAVSDGAVTFDESACKRAHGSALRLSGFAAVGGARTSLLGGWWSFCGGDFLSPSDTASDRLTVIDRATVTNVTTLALTGSSGRNNRLLLRGASEMTVGTCILGRTKNADERSELWITDASQLTCTNYLSFSDASINMSEKLSNNRLVVSNANARLVVRKTTYMDRLQDGYNGGLGGNTLVVTDGARADLQALSIACPGGHSRSNRVVVSRGGVLTMTDLALGTNWYSTPRPDDTRFEVLDGGVVTNTGAVTWGYASNGGGSNHERTTLFVSNATFVAKRNPDYNRPRICCPNATIRISGPESVFRLADSYGPGTPFFYEGRGGNSVILENGAHAALPVTYGFSYTSTSTNNAIIVRTGACLDQWGGANDGSNISMAGYNQGQGPNGYCNRILVESGASVTCYLFRANSVCGTVGISNATVTCLSDRCYGDHAAFYLGYVHKGGFGHGRNVTLALRGTAPKLDLPYGRFKADAASSILFDLPPDGYADADAPRVYVRDEARFDTATDCGLAFAGAEAMLRHHKTVLHRAGRYLLVDAGSLPDADLVVAAAQATLPPGVTLEKSVTGSRVRLWLDVRPTWGAALLFK